MGMDNIQTFNKWKSWEIILEQNKILVYPRPGFDGKPYINHPNVELVEAPLMEISSSFIRQAIKEGKDIRYFLPEPVAQMIYQEGLYL
jgi:nicotinate-nucleotide adenylyltransferase